MAASRLFGINNWDWGTSGFHFESEGWFGTDTKYGGMDKLGHAYTGYVADGILLAAHRPSGR